MAKEKADEKRREALTQCTGLVEEVAVKGGNHMGEFSLGQINSIVHYHFIRNAYMNEDNKKYHKKAQLLVAAKRLVDAHCVSD